MKINKENYEAFFLDYYEGNLTPSEIAELIEFVEMNPQFKSQFEEFEDISLTPDMSVQFEKKESLKKGSHTFLSISQETVQDYLIAEIEGLLSEEEIQHLDTFIAQNPHYQKDRKILRLTKVDPDQQIVFSSKDSLKHKAITVGEIDEHNFEEYLLKKVEGIITHEEDSKLDLFLEQNPQILNDKKVYGLTKLEPDLSITYPDKASLKRTIVPLRRLVYYSLAAAASITLLFGIISILDRNQQKTGLADNSTELSAPVQKNIKTDTEQKGNNQQIAPAQIAYAPKETTSNNTINASSAKGSDKLETPAQFVRAEQGDLLNLVAMNNRYVRSHDHVDPEFMFIRTSQMHSNEYIELYYNIKLAEQIQYAQMNEKDKYPEKTLFNNFTTRVGDLFAQNKKRNEGSSNVSVWTFAELGVKTYNNITKDNVKLDLERDETGKVVGYNLSGDKLDLQREVGK